MRHALPLTWYDPAMQWPPTILQTYPPAPYTTCVQELACGAWVFPGADGSWLCARRQPGGAA